MPAITRSQSRKQSINIPQDKTEFYTKLKNMLPPSYKIKFHTNIPNTDTEFFTKLKNMLPPTKK